MLGIYASLDPVYEDCIFSGVMEHATSTIYHALLGKKAFKSDFKGGGREEIQTSGITRLADIRLLYHTREYNEESGRVIGSLPYQYTSQWVTCAARSYVDIASGRADAEVEVTRKGNLEQIAIFRLMCAAGAVMIDLDGQSIGDKRCLSFGQQESVPLITAATLELALALRDKINV